MAIPSTIAEWNYSSRPELVTRVRQPSLMCGILGIISAPGKTPSLTDRSVIAMRDRMAARGPDDAGLFRRRNVVLAHRRLAIRDLSAGPQPWLSDDGECALVYNGELYNDAELRCELESLGHRFTTRCDTETLMAAYRQWGDECVHKLQGMFAFGVYDFRDDSLLLVRDRFGVKPLFIAEIDGALTFASSIPAILSHPRFSKRPHLPVISHYLTTFRLTLGRSTVFQGIQQLLPAEMLTWKNGRIRIERYWDYPEETDSKADYPAAVKQLRTELGDSVRQRLLSDVPVGLFLSGGVDSNTIACLIRENTTQPMSARCGGDDNRSGDFTHARRCAEFGGFDFGEVRVGPAEYSEVWDRLLDAYQTPVSTPTDVILFRLAEEMKRSVGVVLGGEGADELFCGYAVQHWSGNDFDRLHAASPSGGTSAEITDRFRASLRQAMGRDRFRDRTDFYFAQNSLIPSEAKAVLFQSSMWDAAGRDELMRQTYSEHLDSKSDQSTASSMTRMLHRVNLEGLLSRLDSATMTAGLEARVPYTDHRLVESVFRLPMHFKIDTAHPGPRQPYCAAELETRGELRSKRLLRSVAGQLMPRQFAQRPKASFPTPVAGWLTGEWETEVRQTLLGSRFGKSLFREPVLQELAENLPAAGMWLWPLCNLLRWGDREFA